jgi:hypothetical protein
MKMGIRRQKILLRPMKPQLLGLGAVSLMLGVLYACADLSQMVLNVPVTKVSDVQTRSPKDSTVYLKGTVGKQVPFLGTKAYELQDSTGTIWVITQEKVPKLKDTVLLKGKVLHKNISMGGQTLKEVYVQEEQRF